MGVVSRRHGGFLSYFSVDAFDGQFAAASVGEVPVSGCLGGFLGVVYAAWAVGADAFVGPCAVVPAVDDAVLFLAHELTGVSLGGSGYFAKRARISVFHPELWMMRSLWASCLRTSALVNWEIRSQSPSST